MPLMKPALFCAVLALGAGAALAQDHDKPAIPGTYDLGASTEKFAGRDGATLYQRACSGCHGAEGNGAFGAAAYPPLAVNPRMGAARYPVNLIIEGNGAMPSFAEWLDDAQIAAIANFLRTNLGNDFAGDVTPEDVARMRKEFADLEGG